MELDRGQRDEGEEKNKRSYEKIIIKKVEENKKRWLEEGAGGWRRKLGSEGRRREGRAGGSEGGASTASDAVMFGSLVTRLSGGLSPSGSPRPARRSGPRRLPAARRALPPNAYRDVQSEPEDEPADRRKGEGKSRRRIEKLKQRRLEVSAPVLHGSKSMGRLDGLKQVSLVSHPLTELFQPPISERGAGQA